MDYSLLIMVVTGMMKMATGDDFPLPQGAGTSSRLSFCGYRGLRRRYFLSSVISGGFCIYRILWRRCHAKMGLEGPITHQGAPWCLVATSFTFWSFHEAYTSSFVPEKTANSFAAFGELLFLHKKQHNGSSAENIVSPG